MHTALTRAAHAPEPMAGRPSSPKPRQRPPRARHRVTASKGELEEIIPLVRTSVPPTPQYAWPLLKAQTGVEIVVKHENHTPIGAFKVRGGIVYFHRLRRERPQVQGIVTATRGNHGQSLAFAGARAGISRLFFLPDAAHAWREEVDCTTARLGVQHLSNAYFRKSLEEVSS